MHNTMTVDGRQQSTPASPFHWRSAANASVRFWRRHRSFDAIEAEHDGYLPAVHRRAILRDRSGLWLIADHLLGEGRHHVELRWHLDPAWRLARMDRQCASVHQADGRGVFIASTGSQLTSCVGEPLGWRAPEYGQCVSALTLEMTETGKAPLSVITAIAPQTPARELSLETIEVATDHHDSRHHVAVIGEDGDGRFVALFSTDVLGAVQPGRLSVQRVEIAGGAFHTDARITLLRLSSLLEPTSLTLIDGTEAAWAGPGPFSVGPLTAAVDLHLDRHALSHTSRDGQSDPDITEPTLCVE
jgi:heparinase II/III-like protein